MEKLNNTKKFEELLAELGEIVQALESGNLSLDDSIKQYQRGMELSALCKQKLQEAKEVVVTKMEEEKLRN